MGNRFVVPTPSAGAFNLVSSSAFTSTTSVSINNCFSAIYENYMVVVYMSSTANRGMRMRLRASGTDNTTSNYGRNRVVWTWTIGQSLNQTLWEFPEVAADADQDNYVVFHIFQPFTSKKTAMRLSSIYGGSGKASPYESWAHFNATTSFDGFTMEQTAGTNELSGTVKIYGLAN